MQARALLILVVALVLGILTVVLMNQYLRTQVVEPEAPKPLPTRTVVVANQDLETATRLAGDMLREVQWPEESVPEGAFSSIPALLGEEPPVVLTDIHRGEPLLPHRLSPHGARGGMPARIPEDKRAITVPVNEIRGVAGFVRPGDYVDIIHTTSLGRVDNRPVSRLVLQNVRVLGIDQISQTGDGEPYIARAVTLLVRPFDGQRLNLAQRTGELGMMLRNEFDASLIEEEVATFRELIVIEPRPVVVRERVRRDPEVEVIRGLEARREVVEEGLPVDDDNDD